MSRAVVAAAVALVAMLAAPSPSRAWTCSVALSCPAWGGEIPVALGPLCPDLEAIAPGTTADAIGSAMADWSRIACADIAFGAITENNAPLGTTDGNSTVGFVETGWPFDAAAIGITTIEIGACPGGPCIVEADTSFNAESFVWVTRRGALPEVNAYSIALHELGHYIGLGHSNAPGATMGIAYSRGYLTLSDDDAEGACELYPRDGSPLDCAVAGCPFGQECVDGACVAAAPESCVTAMDCARDERCIEATGLCVRQYAQVPGLGEPCEAAADCESMECEDVPDGRRCTLTCDGLDPRSCPTGFYCDPTLTESCGTGLCIAGTGGEGAFGTPCELATDCASLFCDHGTCSLPCDAAETDNCPAGRTCHPDLDTGCGACHSALPTGEPCLVDTQCESAMCFAESPEEVGWCTVLCADASECPAGFRCEPVGTESLCFPPAAAEGCGCAVAGGGEAHDGAIGAGLGVAAFALASFRRRSRARRGSPRPRTSGTSGACQRSNPT